MFLTPNPYWKEKHSRGWYKNSPAGINEIGKWFKTTAEEAGLDVKKAKICNHSLRSSAISHLAKAGIGEQELIKISGHSSANSLKPYLQLDESHHKSIVESMRKGTSTITTTEVTASRSLSMNTSHQANPLASNCENVTFNNCSFNFN